MASWIFFHESTVSPKKYVDKNLTTCDLDSNSKSQASTDLRTPSKEGDVWDISAPHVKGYPGESADLRACNALSKYQKGSNECKTEQSTRCGKTQHSTGMVQIWIENTSSQGPCAVSMLVYRSLQKWIVWLALWTGDTPESWSRSHSLYHCSSVYSSLVKPEKQRVPVVPRLFLRHPNRSKHPCSSAVYSRKKHLQASNRFETLTMTIIKFIPSHYYLIKTSLDSS